MYCSCGHVITSYNPITLHVYNSLLACVSGFLIHEMQIILGVSWEDVRSVADDCKQW